MQILSTSGWKDYELIDSGGGMRYERFGPYKTVRPDPQAIWQPCLSPLEWQEADVQFQQLSSEKGKWNFKRHLPEKWLMQWKNISFWVRLTSFKHTGVFPEQVLQWEWINSRIDDRKSKIGVENRKLKVDPPSSNTSVLNLFGYTGIASIVAAHAGAKVTHVDASKPSITWARDNQIASKLQDKPIRWILDDAVKFVEREIKRGNTYDAIIMDPPIYGHGPTGQIWKFNENFPKLMENCTKLLSNKPLFVIVNAYAISSSALMLENVLQDFLPKGSIDVGELALQETSSKRLLSTGIFARWQAS